MEIFQIPSFPILLALFLFVCMLINILATKRTRTVDSASKLPPGPWKLPLVGNLHQLLGSTLIHHTFRDLAEKHGPFMCLRIGQIPTIVVSSPEFAKEVMKTNDVVFAFRPQSLFSEIMMYDSTDIVFSPHGEYWRQLRKICVQELLSAARVQSFKHIREEEMFSLMEWIGSNVGSTINLTERIHSSAYSVTSRAVFGNESRDREELVSIVVEYLETTKGFELADLFPSLGLLFRINRARAKFENWKQRNDRILENLINDHIDKKSAAKISGFEREEDLVDVLLKYHTNGDSGFSLTIDNIKAVILDMFGAGSDTSATTLNWAIAELMKNPSAMTKAQDEVRQVLSRKGTVDESCVSEMKYLKSVVKETLRLHPPAPLLLPRESREKCEINGYEIPAKTRVMINAWAMARDPRYWTDPESFVPERFLDSSVDFRGTNFEYIPFGAGRRICPGMLFGLINVEVPLAMLLYHFDWKLPNGMKHEDFDMTEMFGLTVGRKQALNLIPIAYNSSHIEKFTGKANEVTCL